MMQSRLLVAAGLALALLVPSTGWAELSSAALNAFPRPAALEPDVAFWTRVYTEVGTDGGLLHDSRDLAVVYEIIRLPKGLSRRGQERFTDKRKDQYRRILRTLSNGKRSGLTSEERRILELFPQDVSNKKPHPEGLANALDQMGIEPTRSAYVGDSPEDVEMARAAGSLAIAIPGGFPNREALRASPHDHLVDDPLRAVAWLIDRSAT